jgi:hypothetical protein
MKTWLTKFRISNALDDANAARTQVLPRSSQSEEARRFGEAMHKVECRLKSVQPAHDVPPGLHDSVMRAVRGASRAQEPLAPSDGETVAFKPYEGNACVLSVRWWCEVAPRWLTAPVLALLVVGSVWWALNRSEPELQPLAGAGAALEQSHLLMRQTPAAVLAPLSNEMESLNRDFRNAVEFLVASVP